MVRLIAFSQLDISILSFWVFNTKSSLFWTVKPKFVVTPEDVDVQDGSSARLDCEVTGHPRPVITWTFNDGPVDRQRTGITFHFVCFKLNVGRFCFWCFHIHFGSDLIKWNLLFVSCLSHDKSCWPAVDWSSGRWGNVTLERIDAPASTPLARYQHLPS